MYYTPPSWYKPCLCVERSKAYRRLVAYERLVSLLIDGAFQDEIASSSDEESGEAPSLGDTIAGKTKPKKGSKAAKDSKDPKPAAGKGKVRTVFSHSVLIKWF